ncbi:hypothetical protein [Roseateles sp. YR242]|uniref:hypothetical protein n=1 Tax=Roseateles sp. YR242 TaxID=1855305 RepID=UPI0011601AC2|nr:hypothetical protein [Roseateles sp. YR242]
MALLPESRRPRLSGHRDERPAGTSSTLLDIRNLTAAALRDWTDAEIARAGASLQQLILPDACDARTVQRWLHACPNLQDVTACDIQEDGCAIYAQQLQRLRWFRTEPPGPSQLILGLGTRMVIPAWLVTGPRMYQLDQWVQGRSPMPELNTEVWKLLIRGVAPLIEEPASRHRQGIVLGVKQRQAVVELLRAAPQELLSGPNAHNHRAVLARLQRGTGAWEVGYAEFLNFLQPTLRACWEALTKRDEGRSVWVRKSASDLQSLATLRRWMWRAAAGKSAEIHQRIADDRHAWARAHAPFQLDPIPEAPQPGPSNAPPARGPREDSTSSSLFRLGAWPIGSTGRSSDTYP